MLTFSSKRTNSRNFVIWYWLTRVLIISLPALIDLLFNLDLITSNYWTYFIPYYSLVTLISEFQKDRINKLSIDTASRSLTIKYFDCNHGQVHKVFSFDDIRIKILEEKKTWFTERPAAYLYHGNKAVFQINKPKDGFSHETLCGLIRTLEGLTIPVKDQNHVLRK